MDLVADRWVGLSHSGGCVCDREDKRRPREDWGEGGLMPGAQTGLTPGLTFW